MYKLVALDLDGTLLTDEKTITKENLDLIHLLIDKGYEIVIATGRSYYSARVLTDNIKEHLIYICNNGNIVRDAIDDRVLFTNYLDSKDSKIILREGISRGLYPFIHADYFDEGYDCLLGKNHYPTESHMKARNNLLRIKIIEDNLEENLDKVLAFVYPDNFDKLMDFHLYLSEKYPNKFNSHVMEHATQAEALLEVMNPTGTKWNTLIKYATSLGIEANEIIAIGDNNNDIEMIMNAGLGIAMKNGSQLVKEVADIVSKKDNNQSGVAFELKRLLGLSI
ncbi:MAG: Cof-type HAD-IIB family hydrolase [Tissierellaceae bacterium]|nr:Cof-type HAD-IIB family hydrolase [Tissierellaceae bacterium]